MGDMLETRADSARRQDFWLWRLLATGLCFAVFGLGGLLLWALVFPLLRLLGGDAKTRQRRARLTVHYSFRAFVLLMRTSGVLTLDFQGAARLGKPGQMIIANHPSLIDVVLLIATVKDAGCIVRHGLAVNPFTRGPIAACGYIRNDESLEMLQNAADCLRGGQCLIVFPEGTRTAPTCAPQFHRGACAIALRGARCITPVLIRMQPKSLSKGEPWYRIPSRRIRYHISVGQDLDPQHWLNQHPLPIAGRRLNAELQAQFAQGLHIEPL